MNWGILAALFRHTATPANPAAGRNKLYFKSDRNPYCLDSAGVERELSAVEFHTEVLADDVTLAPVGTRMIAFLDPGGADRAVNVTIGTAADRVELTIVNEGDNVLTFDTSGINEAVGSGMNRTFYYNGTTWR